MKNLKNLSTKPEIFKGTLWVLNDSSFVSFLNRNIQKRFILENREENDFFQGRELDNSPGMLLVKKNPRIIYHKC